MNSIEIAKKLIEENNSDIETMRVSEIECKKRIEELEAKIKHYESKLSYARGALCAQKARLETLKVSKKEYLVDNLALKAFIADGGGLDVLESDD